MDIHKSLLIFLGLVSFSCQAENIKSIKHVDTYYMKKAITIAKGNPKAPFAAIIIDNKTDTILATGLNNDDINPIFHGEIVAINNAAKAYPHLSWSNTTLYTTAEPCSMCQSAIIWAGIPRVVYGSSVAYLSAQGWNQIKFTSQEINAHASFYYGVVKGGVLASLTDPLFRHPHDRG